MAQKVTRSRCFYDNVSGSLVSGGACWCKHKAHIRAKHDTGPIMVWNYQFKEMCPQNRLFEPRNKLSREDVNREIRALENRRKYDTDWN